MLQVRRLEGGGQGMQNISQKCKFIMQLMVKNQRALRSQSLVSSQSNIDYFIDRIQIQHRTEILKNNFKMFVLFFERPCKRQCSFLINETTKFAQFFSLDYFQMSKSTKLDLQIKTNRLLLSLELHIPTVISMILYSLFFPESQSNLQNMLTAQQFHKHSSALFSQLQNTDTYDHLKTILFAWRDSPKSAPQSIASFLKVVHLIIAEAPQLLDDLNRCLLKQYSPSEGAASLERVRKLALDNPHSASILDTVITWLRTEQSTTSPAPATKSLQIEELSQSQFLLRLQRHERCKELGKIIYLYRRCIITLKEFKSLIEPIYLSDVSLFNMLYQYAEQLETKRRRVTIFASLNELVDQKYPLQQVGNSYILIPDGYANWGHSWSHNPLEAVLNRLCVSVPLGTQGNFLITRKNQFQEQLLRNEEEKYEIDSNLVCLQAAIKTIEKTRRLTHPLVQRILSNIYTGQVVGIMMRNPNAQVAKAIVIPRLKQKLAELTRCRSKFQKTCEQVASKNFYKSLDYRCFYFCKNDKKFNCPARWEKEIQLRKRQVLQEKGEGKTPQIEDRESLQHSRYYVLNSFDNITTQQLIPQKRVDFEKRPEGLYPRFPQNQVLFLLDFSDSSLLNDVLQILLFHTQKKALLELMVFKMMKLNIDRRLQRFIGLLQAIQGRPAQLDSPAEQLNEAKTSRRVYKDLTDEFLQLIQEEIQPTKVENLAFPFEGPEEHTFIGTKQCYFFLRYLLTIYQRFARAKALAQERNKEQPSLYSQFLAVLIHKIKEQKSLEEYLRKIFQQDAFIFFTLDKLVLGLVKLINNISTDSLTFKLLKEGVRDYDLQIRRWEDYPHATVTQQLSRLYREPQFLFRFTYASCDKMVFVSAWENGTQSDKKKKEGDTSEKTIVPFLNSPVSVLQHKKPREVLRCNSSEYVQDDNGTLMMIGEERLMLKRKGKNLKEWEKELSRFKKVKLF